MRVWPRRILVLLVVMALAGPARGEEPGSGPTAPSVVPPQHEEKAIKGGIQKRQVFPQGPADRRGQATGPGAAPDNRPAAEILLDILRGEATDRAKLDAGESLGRMAAKGDQGALAGLLTVLAEKEPVRNRLFAVIGLGESRSVEAVEPLIEIVRDQTLDLYLRKHAALTLGRLGDPRALPTLRQAVEDPASPPDLRYYAATALYLEPFQKQVPQTPLLLKILEDRAQPQARRARAAQMLSDLGDQTATAPLIALLRTESRSAALEPANPQDLMGQLFGGIMNRQRNVRGKIALALGALGDERAVKPLLQVLNGATDDPIFVEQGRKALAQLQRRLGLGPFLASLKDADPGVRKQAVPVLGGLESPEAERALQAALTDEDAEVRAQAAAALSSLRARRGDVPPAGAK